MCFCSISSGTGWDGYRERRNDGLDADKEEDAHMSGTKIDLIKQLVEQMQAFGVAARKYNLADPDISKLDDGLRERIFGGFDYEKGVQDARKYCKEKTIYVCQDCFKCMNFSFLLPQEKKCSSLGYVC